MSMQFNGSVHADGWLDHMPSGHTRAVPMNDGAVDRESNTPFDHQQSARQRSHTAGWVLLFIVAAGGLSMAAAHQMDPAGFNAKVDAVVASARDLGDKISDQFDNKEPAVNVDVTALATPSEQTAPIEAARAASAPLAASQPEPEPQTQPQPQPQPQMQPQQLLEQAPTGAGKVHPLEAARAAAPNAAPNAAPIAAPIAATDTVSKAALAPPMAVTSLPLQPPPVQTQTQVQPLTPITPVTPVPPVTPVIPVTQAPPIPPATQAPPATQTPPPAPPVQGPQAETTTLDQDTGTPTAQAQSETTTTR